MTVAWRRWRAVTPTAPTGPSPPGRGGPARPAATPTTPPARSAPRSADSDSDGDDGDGWAEAARRRSPAQARHDAFADLVAAAEAHGDAPTRHGTKPHVLITLDLHTLLGRDDLASRQPRFGSGGRIDLRDLEALLRDAGHTDLVTTFGPFRPVAFGTTRRTLPDWARRALHLVHRTCRGPDCDRPALWGDVAHLDPWARDRDTRMDRSIPLCRAHHVMLDDGGWTIHYDPDTAIARWTSPDGRTIVTRPPEP